MAETIKKSRSNIKLETETDILFAEELLVSGTDQEEVKILTHGDLDQSNIMIQDRKITGVIDWGAAGYRVRRGSTYLARTLYVYPTAR